LFVGFLFALMSFAALAQSAITVLIPASVGSTSDTAIRALQPVFEREYGRQLVILNAPGASGLVGLQRYLTMPADGNTLILGSTNFPFLKATNKTLDFDPLKVVEPLHGFVGSGNALLTGEASPVRTVADVAALHKAKGRVTFGSTGGLMDMIAKQIGAQLGIQLEIVGYKEQAQMFLDLANGTIDLAAQSTVAGSVAGFLASGKIKPVAVLGDARVPSIPNVKTMKEQGFKTVEDFAWSGLFIHADAPAAAKAMHKQAIVNVLTSPDFAAYAAQPTTPKARMWNAQQLADVMQRELGLMQ
jgi:tripartite-type tricarboxylate transporter receptor subunit TctC